MGDLTPVRAKKTLLARFGDDPGAPHLPQDAKLIRMSITFRIVSTAARGLAQPGPDQLCILGEGGGADHPHRRRILRGAFFSHAPDPLLDREPVGAGSCEELFCPMPDPLVKREPL